jgi:zinc protease
MPLGGTGPRSLAELLQWQQSQGKLLGVRLQVQPWSFGLAGDTRPADLPAQLQVLAAFARDPGFRPELGEKLMAAAPMAANQIEANAGAVYAREVTRVMMNGEKRLGAIPSTADLTDTRPEDVAAVLRGPLAGTADVVIVGDVSVDAAIAATQATFGAGPNRAPRPAGQLKATPPADGGAPHVAFHRGRADQAILGWHWPMPDRWADPALTDASRVAAAVLESRLVDTVREKLGITYSPSASAGGSLEVPGHGSFSVQIETPPDKFDQFRNLLRAQLQDLAAKPVSADELQRARQPLVETSIKRPETNGHWAYWLPQILRDPRMKEAMLGETDRLKAVTSEQVQRVVRDHLVARPPIEVVARAKAD